jgi:hypothetical protein
VNCKRSAAARWSRRSVSRGAWASTPLGVTLSEETGLQAKSLQGMRRHLPTLVRAGDQFDLAEKAAQREAAQRGAVQKNVAQRKADREKQINDALDVLAPPSGRARAVSRPH